MDLPQTSKLLPLLLFVTLSALAVLYVVIAVKVGKRRESRRPAALARVAAELGMGLTPEDNALLSQFGGFAFHPHGDLPRATSVMRGTIRGSPVVLFDYHVTLGSNDNRNTVRLTVAAFDLASKPLPVFEAEGGGKTGSRGCSTRPSATRGSTSPTTPISRGVSTSPATSPNRCADSWARTRVRS